MYFINEVFLYCAIIHPIKTSKHSNRFHQMLIGFNLSLNDWNYWTFIQSIRGLFITKKFENNSYQLRFSKSSKHFFDSMYVFVFCRVDEINEKMYDFEANKRNNLIFYGIANETRETQPKLLQKATKLLPELPHDENDMREKQIGKHKQMFEKQNMIRIRQNTLYYYTSKGIPSETLKTQIAWLQVAELIRVSLGLRRDIPVSKVVFISFQTPHLIWSSGRIWIPNYVLEHTKAQLTSWTPTSRFPECTLDQK